MLKGLPVDRRNGSGAQLNHRESEDLDFCQWVPDLNNPKYWVNANSIHDELQQRFKFVLKNHLDGSQVNYYIEDPGVKISFYHTNLKQPPDTPESLIGNIKVSALPVLGGSKIFVTTRRTEIRDYYDIYILVSQDYITIDQMLEKAAVISKDASRKKISKLYQKINFSEQAVEEFVKLLKPNFLIEHKAFNDFFHELGVEIQKRQ